MLPFAIDYPENEITITVPKGGDKKKLLDLSEKNAQYFIDEIKNKQRLKLGKQSTDKLELLKQVQEDLNFLKLHFISNVLIIPISRDHIPFLQWFVLKMESPVKKITGILM